MTVILKKQKSLYISASKLFIAGTVVVIGGRLLLKVSPLITIASLAAVPFFIKKIGNFLVGAIGEYLVTKELMKLSDEYFLINDYKILKMQVDHILIGPKGIFTIETKTYFGKVYGNGNENYWKYFLNGFSCKIYSPIKQANGHSIKLSDLFKEAGFDEWINSVVVFAGSVTVKVNPQPIPVVYRKQIFDFINSLPDKLSREQVVEYKDLIMKTL